MTTTDNADDGGGDGDADGAAGGGDDRAGDGGDCDEPRGWCFGDVDGDVVPVSKLRNGVDGAKIAHSRDKSFINSP